MDERTHTEWHVSAQKAADAHRKQRLADDILTEPRSFPCLFAPGDTLEVNRMGARNLASSFVQVVVTTHGQASPIGLTATHARALAAALLDVADEVDPYIKGTAPDDVAGE